MAERIVAEGVRKEYDKQFEGCQVCREGRPLLLFMYKSRRRSRDFQTDQREERKE